MPFDSNLISAIALIISILSFCLSSLGFLRDRSRIVTSSEFYTGHSNYSPHMKVKIVNHGRRIAVLRMLGGTIEEGAWSATYLNDKNQSSLTENQFYEQNFYRDDLYFFDPEGEVGVYKELWVEDSLGRKHKIKNSKENIKKLLDAHGDK